MVRGEAVRTFVAVIIGVAVSTSCALAQTAPPQVPPPASPPTAPPTADPQQPPAAIPQVTTAPASALIEAPIDTKVRREQIRMMEGLLAGAVRSGAEETARLIQKDQPGLMLFTGIARARGFSLEGYGVVFHVEIPGVVPSVASILESMERNKMRQQGQPSLANDGARPRTADESYTEAVQRKLINAMLDYRIALRPDEWLTIAARDGEGPPAPGQIFESITLFLRIKGSDLSEFLAGRISQDEVRKRVEVREF